MYVFICLLLFSGLVFVGGNRVDISSSLDRLFEKVNDYLCHTGSTSGNFPEIPLDSKVKYHRNIAILGLDSLRRTGDCWQEVKGNDIQFDISFGLGLLTMFVPLLNFGGKNMSAYARVRDNSMHLSFTVNPAEEKCHVKLNDMRIEKFENVEFGASMPEYDDSNLEELFKSVLRPKLNTIIDSNFEKIENSFQELCKVKDFITAGDVEKLAAALQ